MRESASHLAVDRLTKRQIGVGSESIATAAANRDAPNGEQTLGNAEQFDDIYLAVNDQAGVWSELDAFHAYVKILTTCGDLFGFDSVHR